MKKLLLILIVIILIVVLLMQVFRDEPEVVINEQNPPVATSTAPVMRDVVNGEVTLGLNESFATSSVSVKVWAVTEDSRCPTDVTCVQAGRVSVALEINSTGTSTDTTIGTSTIREIVPGDTVTTDDLIITLEEVRPQPVSTRKTADDEYRFDFIIESRE